MPSVDDQAVATARLWIGTPYMTGQAVRGLGCDCVGLIRGVWSDLTGQPAPLVPGWRMDWAEARGRPLVEAGRRYLIEADPTAPQPGQVVVLRMRGNREAHCGIMDLPRDGAAHLIHAMEDVGVVSVPFHAFAPRAVWAGGFPPF